MQDRQGSSPERSARVAAIVLAAGESRRFGGNKLLFELDGEPLVRRTVRGVLASGIDEVHVVIGHRAPEIRNALAGLPVSFAYSADYHEGMGRSLATGIRALSASVEAAIIVLADQPTAPAEVIPGLLAAFRTAGVPIVVPDYEGERGPPVLVARRVFGELTALAGDRGAREVVERDPARVLAVPAGPMPPDIDLREDIPGPDPTG